MLAAVVRIVSMIVVCNDSLAMMACSRATTVLSGGAMIALCSAAIGVSIVATMGCNEATIVVYAAPMIVVNMGVIRCWWNCLRGKSLLGRARRWGLGVVEW
jgi:hypothetical protein